MKKLLTLLIIISQTVLCAQDCDPAEGNVVIYANYDGGVLNINCDQDIPDLKIGICTYENCEINIGGPFAGNVTQVIYAGFQGDNDHCNTGMNNTTINGVNSSITDIFFAPPGVLTDANGNASMICAYSCGTGSQGGCNTASQVVAYFLNQFGGNLHSYITQYGCWNGEGFNISDNTCCDISIPNNITTTFTASDLIVCVGQCIDFMSESTGGPTEFEWTFTGANVATSSEENPEGICFVTPGEQSITLTASNGQTSGSYSSTVQVIACGIPGCTYEDAMNYDPQATADDGSCTFDCDEPTCLADITNDGIINTADLTLFLAAFGTTCE